MQSDRGFDPEEVGRDRAKGLDAEEAEKIAKTIMKDSEVALDTMAREELGLDPDELGSPWSAALSSLLAFALFGYGVFYELRQMPASSGAPRVGEKAPEFTLPDQFDREYGRARPT